MLPISKTIIFACLLYQVFAQERKISLFVNPGCNVCGKSILLVHLTGDSENDTIHHIWDFSSKPAIFLALTPLNSTLVIDWETFLSSSEKGSIKFSQTPTYMFSLIFDKIIEFNDVNDTGELGENFRGYTQVLKMEDFNWNFTRIQNNADSKYAIVEVEGRNHSDRDSRYSGGIVKFMIKAFGSKDHGSMPPHLFHTTNASQITVSLDNLQTHNPNARYALKLITVSTDSNASIKSHTYHSINDEHSPGIFKITEFTTPNIQGHSLGGYLQWRSVAYTSSDNAMTNTTDIHDSKIYEGSLEEVNRTVIYSTSGFNLLEMSINSFNISFGTPEDGFYRKTNFISWTVMCGLGEPAEEEFSLIVLLVLAIGLGLPALLIILGIFCLAGRQISHRRDELFLSH